jgi:hypothetical protein
VRVDKHSGPDYLPPQNFLNKSYHTTEQACTYPINEYYCDTSRLFARLRSTLSTFPSRLRKQSRREPSSPPFLLRSIYMTKILVHVQTAVVHRPSVQHLHSKFLLVFPHLSTARGYHRGFSNALRLRINYRHICRVVFRACALIFVDQPSSSNGAVNQFLGSSFANIIHSR